MSRNVVRGHDIEIQSPNPIVYQELCFEGQLTPEIFIDLFFESHKIRNVKPKRGRTTYRKQAENLLNLVGAEKAYKLLLEAHRRLSTPFGFNYLRRLYDKNIL